jgi:hypothetical protein
MRWSEKLEGGQEERDGNIGNSISENLQVQKSKGAFLVCGNLVGEMKSRESRGRQAGRPCEIWEI